MLVQVTQHGACLGLGLAALGTQDEEVFEEVKSVLYTDSAVAGEAAGIALGLLSVGSATDKASELLTYAHDTQHEKVPKLPCYLLAHVFNNLHLAAQCLGSCTCSAQICM
jgi:cytolysin (calcineurin-like family phosphatase)